MNEDRTKEQVEEELKATKAELEALKEEVAKTPDFKETVEEIQKANEKKLEEISAKHAAEVKELKDVVKQLVSGEKAPEPEQSIADKINAKHKQNSFI